MLSKDEVADVISYCKEHGCSYKERLAELRIPEWKFYDSKYKYAIRERKECDKGRFLQLRTGSDGSMAPFPSFDSAKTGRKADKAGRGTPQYSMLSIELQTAAGTMMRIQGDMTPDHLAAIIQSSSRHV